MAPIELPVLLNALSAVVLAFWTNPAHHRMHTDDADAGTVAWTVTFQIDSPPATLNASGPASNGSATPAQADDRGFHSAGCRLSIISVATAAVESGHARSAIVTRRVK